ncbi:MAG TPA: methylmalonyl-CoA epimerase [Nitrososphaerales archaeon]|nr:methylmalonyl-CoA epimerase [Nitrososphaerales archaeon]
MAFRFDHVGIAVRSVDQMLAIYSKIGRFEVRQTEVAGQKAKIALLKAGETSVEFLEPTSEDSTLAKFIRERGEGLHHIAFEVDDIEKSTEELKGQGFRFVYDRPADGKFGSKVNFMHPKTTGGVLVELTQRGPE